MTHVSDTGQTRPWCLGSHFALLLATWAEAPPGTTLSLCKKCRFPFNSLHLYMKIPSQAHLHCSAVQALHLQNPSFCLDPSLSSGQLCTFLVVTLSLSPFLYLSLLLIHLFTALAQILVTPRVPKLLLFFLSVRPALKAAIVSSFHIEAVFLQSWCASLWLPALCFQHCTVLCLVSSVLSPRGRERDRCQ